MELLLHRDNRAADFRVRRARKDILMWLKEDTRCS